MVGGEENPFFRFFRTNVRAFEVKQAGGSLLHVPAISFLRNVRDGKITPHKLADDAFQIADHFVILARELLLELIRSREFPDAPSRWRGIWIVKDLETLALWRKRLEQQGIQSQFVEMVATGRAHDCDASFILGDSETLDESERKARDYWGGKIAAHRSEPETLFEGEITVSRILEPKDF